MREDMAEDAMRYVFICIMVVVATVLVPGLSTAAPKLEISTNTWDFGEIYQWTNPSFNVGIINSGDEPLKITDVKAACGCTATFLSSKVINPGDKGFLKIDLASYAMTGKILKLVRLATNDPAAPQVDITIRGFVKDDKAAVGELDKDYVDLGVVAPYETRNIAVVIKNHGNIDLDIGNIELPDGYFMDSAYPTKAKPLAGIEVQFGYRPTKDKGPIDDVIKIKTSGLNGGDLSLKVVGYVSDCMQASDDLVVTPTMFTADRSGGGELVLSVKNNGHATVTIDGVDSSLDTAGIEEGAPEIKPGEAGTVKLKLSAKTFPADAKGYIYIRLGLPVKLK
jgi:Protein of unknown function (DUF1573)